MSVHILCLAMLETEQYQKGMITAITDNVIAWDFSTGRATVQKT